MARYALSHASASVAQRTHFVTTPEPKEAGMFQEPDAAASPVAMPDPAARGRTLPNYAALMLDASHRIRACGSAAATLFGYPIQAMIGQPVTMLLPDLDALTGMQERRVLIQLSKVRLDGVRADGTPLRVIVSLLNDLDGGSGQHLLCIRALSPSAKQGAHGRSSTASSPAQPGVI